MSLKKNFIYTSLLTVSSFLFPLLTYPYISRVLGVTNIGICNFVDSIINYYLLFSMMGIALIGIREIANNKENKDELNKTFSSLFFLNSISTLLVLTILILSIILVPTFWEYKELMLIGAFKLIFNLFLIEWFFRGIEKFKYITIVTLLLKTLYVILVFLYVKKESDYNIFYGLTTGILIINSIFNWFYSRNYVKLKYELINFRPYLKSFFNFGFYGLLTSMYTSFNVVFLGFISGQTEVGYYTTATKLYGILISLFSAFTAVMLPRMSSLVTQKDTLEMNRLIDLSFEILLIFCLPAIVIAEFYAPQIIMVLSGPGYEGAILPMRILIPLILIIGLEQIFIIQILMPLKRDKEVLINSSVGAAVSLIANILIVKHFASVGSSIVWLLSEAAILLMAIYFVKKSGLFTFNANLFSRNLIASVPYILICALAWLLNSSFLQVIVALLFSIIYFLIYHLLINKTALIISILNDSRNVISKLNLQNRNLKK